jgi:WD40 repeat protein
MRLLRAFGAILVCFSTIFTYSALGDDAPAPRQLKTYPVHNNPDSADISPDDRLVVTAVRFPANSSDPGDNRFVEAVQLWNFKLDKLVAEFRLPPADVKTPYGKGSWRFDLSDRFARFSPDGGVVIALIQRTLYVLSSKDLSTLKVIPMGAPSNTADKPRIRAFELSPSGSVAAVLWVTGMLYGTVALYDYSAGKFLRSWDTPQGWIAATKDVAWTRDGRQLLVGIPTELPCGSPGNGPDVFVFDADAGTIAQKFRTGLTAGSIAVAGDHVLAVDENCVGLFEHHDPELRVFELPTGKKVREVSGRGAGVRYRVSASANGNRFLAFTGIMRMHFDWSDAVRRDKTVDETFTVWNATDYSAVATSQNIPGLKSSELRISATGAYALSCGKASLVYELP